MNITAKKKVSMEAVSIFVKQFAVLLDAGLSFTKTIYTLYNQTTDKKLKFIIEKAGKEVYSTGTTIYRALEKFSDYLPQGFAQMIEVGEKSGSLSVVLGKMSESYEKELKLQNRVKAALTYPVMAVIFALAAVILIIKFMLPVFVPILLRSSRSLSLITKILIKIVQYSGNNFLMSVSAAVIFFMFFIIMKFIDTPIGKSRWNNFILSVPMAGIFIKKIILSKFCRALEILYSSGTSFVKSLNILKNTFKNEFLERELKSIISYIEDGQNIGESFARGGIFPSMFTQMIIVGEESGELGGMLVKIADFYDVEIENALEKMVVLIEPLLLLVLGIAITFILLGFFLPLYDVGAIMGK